MCYYVACNLYFCPWQVYFTSGGEKLLALAEALLKSVLFAKPWSAQIECFVFMVGSSGIKILKHMKQNAIELEVYKVVYHALGSQYD